jgi:hypothetical protein
MLKWLLSGMMASGLGDRFDGGAGGDLASLTAALGNEKKKGEQPLSRLQDAFKQLKDMHRDDQPFNFETAQWPYGPIGAPSQAMAAAPTVPMPRARPAEAPMSPQEAENIYDSFENSPAGKRMRAADLPASQSSPFADFFARNTAMMKDPTSGEFIDPSAAAQHGGSGILNGLFG